MPRRPKPDLRPSWRDPNMPVMRDYVFADGTTKTVIDPDYERRFRAHMMEAAPHPDYKDDPTYNMKRKK